MGGCVKALLRSVETSLSPRVMKAPCAQSRRHLRVAFVFVAPTFLQTPSTHISMPKPIDEAFGWNGFCNYASPEMTKPPEGGLSPKEHLAKPDGQGVSRVASVPKTPDDNDFEAIELGPSG